MSDDNPMFKKLLEFIKEANDKQTKEINGHIDKEILSLKNIIQEETEKRIKLERQYAELKEKYQVLEKAHRKNNIIIFGLHNDTEKSLTDFTIETLNNHLNVDISKHDINNIFTIGKETHNKPIIVKLVSYLKKIEILKAAPKLKGSSISIAEELTIEERRQNKILKQHLREARSKGLNAYIKRHKLYVNNEEYTAEQLTDNERDSQLENKDIEEQEKEDYIEELHQKGKTNSAPPTPTQSNKRSLDIDNDNVTEKPSDAASKKRRVIQPVQQRSSPRLVEMESKSNKGN